MPSNAQESLNVYSKYGTAVSLCASTKNALIYLSALDIPSSFAGNYKEMYQWDAHLDLGL